MTDHEPMPQGRTGQAWRTLLARCHKSEDKVRVLKARVSDLEKRLEQEEG